MSSRHACDYERRTAEFRLIEDLDPGRDEPVERVRSQEVGAAPTRTVGSPEPRRVPGKARTVPPLRLFRGPPADSMAGPEQLDPSVCATPRLRRVHDHHRHRWIPLDVLAVQRNGVGDEVEVQVWRREEVGNDYVGSVYTIS